jgi:DNA-binding YbaB/EbfC family protein
MVNINQIMKQMQSMQQKVMQAQEEMAQKEFEGSSGGGLVKIVLNGKGIMNKISLDPSLLDKNEADVLEDLILAAFNDAKKKLDEEMEGSMSNMMGGMPLPPGLKFPF